MFLALKFIKHQFSVMLSHAGDDVLSAKLLETNRNICVVWSLILHSLYVPHHNETGVYGKHYFVSSPITFHIMCYIQVYVVVRCDHYILKRWSRKQELYDDS